jgi:hypothetical protein
VAFLGAILFVLIFVMIAPQTRIFLLGLATGAGAWIADWAPFSYILLLILLAAPFAGMHLVRTAPLRVDEENPMAKYRKELPLDED